MTTTQKMLAIIIVLVTFVVGFILGKMDAPEYTLQTVGSTPTTQNEVLTPESGTSTIETGTRVDASNLTPAQRTMLETFGINPDEIIITPEMAACAEAKIGAERMLEIKNGASPSMMEGLGLVACYK